MQESQDGVARLACSELWGGSRKVVHPVELPGLVGWVSCTPFGDADSGGDVHYMSVCSEGQVSRIALADVAGHGDSASAVAERLRRTLQQHTDNWDQSALMRELNDAFKRDATGVQFATAAVLGFYIGTGELLFSNAGHLPLLWHHAETGIWDWLEEGSAFSKNIEGLPLGLISGTTFAQIGIQFGHGDTLLLYTDGITESRNESGAELGGEGLLALAREVAVSPRQGPLAYGQALLAGLKLFRKNAPQRDDETLVLIQRQGTIGQIY